MPDSRDIDFLHDLATGANFRKTVEGVHFATIIQGDTSEPLVEVSYNSRDPDGQLLPDRSGGHLSLSRTERSQWKGYRLDFYGWIIVGQPNPPQAPTITLPPGNILAASVTVQLVRQQARYQESPLRAERIWIPREVEHAAIRGLEHPYSLDDLKRAAHALDLLRDVVKAYRPGRPRTPEEEIRAELERAITALLRQGVQPTLSNTALELGYSEDQAKRRRKRLGITWEELVNHVRRNQGQPQQAAN